ncbi:MAG TPA: hypothetical protein VGB69_12975 [Edaphobacter sp.]
MFDGEAINLSEREREERAAELRLRALDLRIVEDLERAPDLSSVIPSDFAARVAAKVPARRPLAARQVSHYGRTLLWIGLVVLFLALLALATRGNSGSVVDLAVEWTLCLQFLAIAVWLGVSRRSSR